MNNQEITVRRLLELCKNNVNRVSIDNTIDFEEIEVILENKTGKYSDIFDRLVDSFSPFYEDDLKIYTKENNNMKEVNNMKNIDDIKTPKDIVDTYEQLRLKAEEIGYPIRYDTHGTPLDLYYNVDYNNILCDKSSIRDFNKTFHQTEVKSSSDDGERKLYIVDQMKTSIDDLTHIDKVIKVSAKLDNCRNILSSIRLLEDKIKNGNPSERNIDVIIVNPATSTGIQVKFDFRDGSESSGFSLDIFNSILALMKHLYKVNEENITAYLQELIIMGKSPINGNKDLRKLIEYGFNENKFTSTIDSNRRLILSTSPDFVPESIGIEAYEDVDFITLHRDDAKCVVKIIEEAITRIGGDKATDIEVFGDKSISFERLYDRIAGLLYHIRKDEE